MELFHQSNQRDKDLLESLAHLWVELAKW